PSSGRPTDAPPELEEMPRPLLHRVHCSQRMGGRGRYMATSTLLGLVMRLTQRRRPLARAALARENMPLLGIAGTSFLAHLLVAWNYGCCRDEISYIAAGQHLALGYVDFPPMIAFLAALLHVVGDSLLALHVVSALAAACLIFVAGLMARELGGKRFAQ